MLTSNTDANPGRKFLTCQYTICRSFQWLDEAVAESISTCSTPKQHVSEGCFECGATDHWHSKCPWLKIPCRVEGCSGLRKLKTSGKKCSRGEQFLRCNECPDFQWLKDAKKDFEDHKESTPTNARIIIEAKVADICAKIDKGLALFSSSQ
ncbi:hypothetical protein BVC80_605g15 [Macleaya cordata]|uniref:GRF-type domain-containing protein n=1 Tax=Macleaya cordata TaxID=56857 RepID=A0A200R0G6_MACCD|nr:hypothetical protein BVC80_605g15 [Macleaya cordata]